TYEDWMVAANRRAFASHPIVIRNAPTVEAVRMTAAQDADFTVVGTEGAFKWVREDVAHLAILFPVSDPVQVGWGVSASAPNLAQTLEKFFEDSKHVDSDLDRNWREYYRVSLMEYQLFDASFSKG